MTTASSDSILNFAYGSNMLTSRIRERVSSARPLGTAVLRGHELRWHKRSTDGSGKCDVVEVDDTEAMVFGVLYEFLRAEKRQLDRAEGVGSGYAERAITVEVGGQPIAATLYYATIIDPSLKPYSWYRDIVVAGAREHYLPKSYIASLQATAAIEDADVARCMRHRGLLTA